MMGRPWSLAVVLGLFALGSASAGQASCIPATTRLCLQGRFGVEVAWQDFSGHSGRGTSSSLTSDTGTFWFFAPGNIELIVKVLDGRAVNHHFWVFYGALSDVAYTLTVTDTLTGKVKVYTNPAKHLASVADVLAFGPFAAPPSPAVPPAASDFHGAKADPILPRKGLSCTPSDHSLCLGQGRFQLVAYWRDFQGNAGQAHAQALAEDTGYFWFFSPSNVELVVKVLDGRALNSNFWLFYGALSNVEYILQVTDTTTGAIKAYRNLSGNFGSLADTKAFSGNENPADLATAFKTFGAALDDESKSLLPISANVAIASHGLAAQLESSLSCLAVAAAGTTTVCKGLDPGSGNLMNVEVTPEQARWIGSLFAAQAGEQGTTQSSAPARSQPASVGQGITASGPVRSDVRDFSKDTALPACPGSYAGTAAGTLTCRFLNPQSQIMAAYLAAARGVLGGACEFVLAPTPQCRALMAIELFADSYSALYCNFSPIYLESLGIAPRAGLQLGFDDSKSFQVLANLHNKGEIGSLRDLVATIVDGFLEEVHASAATRALVREAMITWIVEQAVNTGELQLDPRFSCSLPVPDPFGTAALQLDSGSGVKVDGQTLKSGAQEAAGRILPHLAALAPWSDSTIRLTAPFVVKREICSGSGKHKLETFSVSFQNPKDRQMIEEGYYTDCHGTVSGWDIYPVPIYPGAPGSTLLPEEKRKLTRCDGAWQTFSAVRSAPECQVYSEECSLQATAVVTFNAGLLTEEGLFTGTGVDPNFSNGPLRITQSSHFISQYDLTSSFQAYNYRGYNVWSSASLPACARLNTVASDQYADHFEYTPEPPLCRMVDKCPGQTP
jgi:hypothetical protein